MTQLNQVDFETGDFTQCISHTGGSVQSGVALRGSFSAELNRSASAANCIVGASSTAYVQLSNVVYFGFLWRWDSQSGEAGICNIVDSTGSYLAALHISSTGLLIFYDVLGTALATGTTAIGSSTTTTLGVKIDRGTNSWEVRINNATEISGTNASLGTDKPGGINCGGGSNYTQVSYYDQVTLDDAVFPYPLTAPATTVGQTLTGIGLFF